MSSIIDLNMATTALPTTTTMSRRLTTGSTAVNSTSSTTAPTATVLAATSSNRYQELLERVIRRENTSVIRVVWYVIEQTKRGHIEVEASYSQLQTALNLSRCGVSMGVSRALEAGYIVRTNNNNNNVGTGGGGNGGGNHRNNGGGSTGNSRGVSADHHATARYVINLPLPPVTPDPSVGDMQSGNQTSTDNEAKAAAATEGSNEQEQEGELALPQQVQPQAQPQVQQQQEEGSVKQTVVVNSRSRSRSFLFSDFPPDSNIESFIELEELEAPVEVESLTPAGRAVGKPDRQPALAAEAEGTAQAASDDNEDEDEDEDEGDDNGSKPDGGLMNISAPSSTSSEPQEQPREQEQEQEQMQVQAQAKAGSETDANTEAEAAEAVRAKSEYLANLSRDFSRELGDLAHGRSNLTQIHNLWRESGLSEQEFGALLYQSRDLTRRYAVLRPGETPPPGGKPRNRMAYFFTVVRNMLGLRPAAATATVAPALATATSAPASAIASISPHARPNLRYGWGAGECDYKQAQVQPQAQTKAHNQSKPEGGMVSPPQTQAAQQQRQQAPVLSSEASASARASASNSSPVWSRSNHNKTQAKVEKGKGQAVAPNGVKLLHASWLQFVQ